MYRVKEVERWLSFDTPFCVIPDKSGSDVRWGGREEQKEEVLCFTLQWARRLSAGTPATLCEASRYGNTV